MTQTLIGIFNTFQDAKMHARVLKKKVSRVPISAFTPTTLELPPVPPSAAMDLRQGKLSDAPPAGRTRA